MSIIHRVYDFKNSSLILAVLLLRFTVPVFRDIYICMRVYIIKARFLGVNENVFHWKYLLSKKNNVPQQNAPTLP